MINHGLMDLQASAHLDHLYREAAKRRRAAQVPTGSRLRLAASLIVAAGVAMLTSLAVASSV
jgi:hypothetical protein